MVTLFNNLKACFDCIRPALNTITTRRVGCSKGIAEYNAKALRLMEHVIKTSFGICNACIVWDIINNLGGIGQGSGAGPVSWHSHMLLLMESFEELAPHRAHFMSPDKKVKISQWLIGFVDNNTIVFTLKDKSFNIEAIKRLFWMANECLET